MKMLPNTILVIISNLNNNLVKKLISINHKINNFKKSISVDGDKSLSIRFVLLSSLSEGKSVAKNLLVMA